MPICVIHGPSSPKPSERSQRHCPGSKEELHIFSELRETGSVFQSIYKEMFTYSPPDVQKTALLNTYGRENAPFFFQTVYVRCPDGTCTGLNAPVALEDVNESLRFDSLFWTCVTEMFLTGRSFLPGQVVPVHRPCTSKAKSCHPRPSHVSSSSLQMELLADVVFCAPPLFG